jgi:allantoin racemase
LINPNISERVTEILAREARSIVGARAEIRAMSPPFGSASLECNAEAVIAAHGVLATIAANQDCDAAVIAAFGDPGLDAAREISAMPVYGLGRSGLRAAAGQGRRYAILTIGPRLRQKIERAAAAYGQSGSLVSLRFLDVSVLDAARDRDGVQAAALEMIKACIEQDGAEALLLGGAPFVGMARTLNTHVRAPIYDGLEAALERALAAPRFETGAAADPPRKERRGVSEALAARIDQFLQAGEPPNEGGSAF